MPLVIDTITVEGTLDSKAVRTQVRIQALANSTLALVINDAGIQIFTGSTAGQIVKMPVANTGLLAGHRFILINQGTKKITLQDQGGNLLTSIPANHQATAHLQDASTANGIWDLDSDGVIDHYYQSSTSAQSFTSATDTTVTGLSVTPTAGRWLVMASLAATIANNGTLGQFSLYTGGTGSPGTGGTQVADSIMAKTSAHSSENFPVHLQTRFDFDGATQLDVRGNTAGGQLSFAARSITLIRVDA